MSFELEHVNPCDKEGYEKGAKRSDRAYVDPKGDKVARSLA